MNGTRNSSIKIWRWTRAAIVAVGVGVSVAAQAQTPPPVTAPTYSPPTIGNPSQPSAPTIGNPSQPSTPTIGNPSQPSAHAKDEDIRDIRGVRHIPYSWLWAAWLTGGLAAAGLLAWAWRYWKNRPKTIVKLPHEIALEKLEMALMLMNPEHAREFSIAVSDAVRVYIEARFESKAAHRTTEEFLHQLLFDVMSPLAPYSDSLGDFLKYCDLAKFAKWSLSIPEMQSMHESARKFIEETKPQPGVAAAPKVPPEFTAPRGVAGESPSRPLSQPQPPTLSLGS